MRQFMAIGEIVVLTKEDGDKSNKMKSDCRNWKTEMEIGVWL